MNFMKKIVALSCATAFIISGIIVTSVKTDAASATVKVPKPDVSIDFTDGKIKNEGKKSDILVGAYTMDANKNAKKFVETNDVTYTTGKDGDANGAIVTHHSTGAYTVVKDYAFGTSNFTVSAWIYVPSGATLSGGAATYLFGTMPPDNVYSDGGFSGTDGFAISLKNSQLRIVIMSDSVQNKEVSYERDQWYNVTVKRNGTEFIVFFDGEKVYTCKSLTADTTFGTKDLAFGAYIGRTTEYQNDNTYFDDIKVYSTAEKDAVIKQNATRTPMVCYESCNMADYWTTEKKTTPTKADYVFGGWYTLEDGAYTALREGDISYDGDGKATESNTYAKFVPASVLSVKAQNESGTAAGDEKVSSVRVISAVDSTSYQKVGFDILINNKNKLRPEGDPNGELETTQIFEGLLVGESEIPFRAEELFGGTAKYLSVWRLDNIADKHDAKIINVTPYWITLDGTKVEGLSKYIHVEDGYNRYISVPINLCEADGIAAGMLTINYPSGLTLVEDKVEFDGVFPSKEATFYDDGNGTIRIVGNGDTVDTLEKAEGIFVNLRFQADDTVFSGAGQGVFLTFDVENEMFCNWNEEEVVVDAWDVQY